jgi:hypothetical protein
VDEFVLPNHDLLDLLAVAQLCGLWVVKGRRDLATQHQCQPLDAVKVSVLDRHDTCDSSSRQAAQTG